MRLKTYIVLLIVLALFIASAYVGTLTPADFKNNLYTSFYEQAKQILGNESFSPSDLREMLMLPMKIFTNNLLVAVIIYVLSPTIIGSILFYIYQGFIIGAIMTAPLLDANMLETLQSLAYCRFSEQDLVVVKIALLLPHGVFEIPGIAFSLIASIVISKALIDLIRRKLGRTDLEISMRSVILRSLRYMLYSALLLVIAAFIEVFITPLVGGFIVGLLCLFKA
ncbi:MAG: stage II sporulation protein M [Sulfolobales archaeon]